MAHRYVIGIIGYIIADDLDELTEILEDVAGAGMNIERATADGAEVWRDERAASAGFAND